MIILHFFQTSKNGDCIHEKIIFMSQFHMSLDNLGKYSGFLKGKNERCLGQAVGLNKQSHSPSYPSLTLQKDPVILVLRCLAKIQKG
jgi:hypothetical protein